MLTTDRPPEGTLTRRASARLAGLLLSIPPWLASLVKAGPRGLGQVLAAAFHFARDERRAARIDDMAGTGHARQLIEEEIHQRAMKIRTALILLPPARSRPAAVYARLARHLAVVAMDARSVPPLWLVLRVHRLARRMLRRSPRLCTWMLGSRRSPRA